MNNDIVNIVERIGIKLIDEDFAISGNGDISYFFELDLKEVFSMDATDYNNIHRRLSQAIGGSNDNVVFHFVNMVFTEPYTINDVGNSSFASSHNLELYQSKTQLRLRNFMIVSYPTLGADYFPTYQSTSFIKTSNLLKDDVFKKIRERHKFVQQELVALTNELKGDIFMGIKLLQKQGISDFLYNAINGTFDDWVSNVGADHKINPVVVSDTSMQIGSSYLGVVSFVNEAKLFGSHGKTESLDTEIFNSGVDFKSSFGMPSSMGYPITIGIPMKHLVHTVIENKNQNILKDHLIKQNTGLNFLRGFGNQTAALKQSEIEVYCNEIQKEKACLFKQSIWMYGDTPNELNKHLKLAQTAYKKVGNGCESFIENMQTANLFFSTIPGCARENFMYNYSYVSRAVSFIPKETVLYNDPRGLKFIDPFGNVVIIEFGINKHTTNGNMLILGPSGTGKSVMGNEITTQNYSKGAHTVILDVGGSYKLNTLLHEGKYIDCGDKANLSFNIFDTVKNHRGEYIARQFDSDGAESIDKISFLYVILTKILYGQKTAEYERPESKQLILTGIEEYYNYVNRIIVETQKEYALSFTDFVSFYNKYYKNLEEGKKKFLDIESFNLLVESYIGNGSKAYLLNGTTKFDITADRWVVFDVAAIQSDPDLLGLVSTIVVDITDRKLSTLPLYVPKEFRIDEALDFLRGGSMGEYIAGMYRKIRKKGGCVSILTQSAEFLETCEKLVKDSILNNADYKIVLGLPNVQAEEAAKKLLNLTDSEINEIREIKPKSEFFMKMGKRKMVLKNMLSKETLASYTTDPDELGVILEYIKKYNGDVKTAILNYCETK